MRFLILVGGAVLGACTNGGSPQCAEHAATLAARLDALDALVRDLSAPNAHVSGTDLPEIALALKASLATDELALDVRGERWVAGTKVAPSRRELCLALGTGGPVRVHIAASATAQQAAELLVDLHSCSRSPEIMLRIPDPAPRLTLPPPRCPRLADAPEAPLPEAIVAGWRACDCDGPIGAVVSLYQQHAWPEVFTTVLPLALSPSGLPLEPTPGESWEHALTRWLPYLGPEPQRTPRTVWMTSSGSLRALDPPDVLDTPEFLKP